MNNDENTKNAAQDLENGITRKDQENLSQKALGNDDVNENPEENNNDILTTPRTSGTGSNNAAAAPDSLIVHEDKKGDDRYENGKDSES